VHKTREKGAEISAIFKIVFIEKTVGRAQILELFRCLKYGLISAKFDELSGHPLSSRNDETTVKVRDRVTADLRTSSTEVAKENIWLKKGKLN